MTIEYFCVEQVAERDSEQKFRGKIRNRQKQNREEKEEIRGETEEQWEKTRRINRGRKSQ